MIKIFQVRFRTGFNPAKMKINRSQTGKYLIDSFNQQEVVEFLKEDFSSKYATISQHVDKSTLDNCKYRYFLLSLVARLLFVVCQSDRFIFYTLL